MCECWCRPSLVYGFKVSPEDVSALATGGDPAVVLSAAMERLLNKHRGISVHRIFLGDYVLATVGDGDGEKRSVRVRSCVVGVRALSDSVNAIELQYEEDRALKEGLRVVADVLAMRLKRSPFAFRWYVGLSE
ncbi:hypothetical protein QKT49_gp309 [Acanthamoeba castellanii medusavirus]|uniref:Uncharacterized protein n=1 Tax=Acanthamoeba castellanii medusavirus J1 TaxID=3114988 RepID=A0A3T1CX98_9VIRU|nr:hypothetical protein QKT49_gp309 [Acanthamoeba castellanii medusavirus]BBI30454.1 hypothetical protein [Acanthamoeba castellanii medusavirus J1]